MTTYYTLAPTQGQQFAVGEVLLPAPGEFPANVALVRVRRVGEYEWCGYAENDCARGLRADGVRRLRVVKVSDISGYCTAVAEGED